MSRTWLLTNSAGDKNFTKGDADLVWEAGAPVEINNPLDVIDQRVRKISNLPFGGNPFSKNLGFAVSRFIGQKNLGENTGRKIAVEAERMVSAMIVSQKEVAARVDLDPNELISSVEKIQLVLEADDVSLAMTLRTQGGDVVVSTVNGLLS